MVCDWNITIHTFQHRSVIFFEVVSVEEFRNPVVDTGQMYFPALSTNFYVSAWVQQNLAGSIHTNTTGHQLKYCATVTVLTRLGRAAE